ncbi:hypothetical protein K435DRAFT_874497 [Dendrothele bispora CBS 962.96]|uniref:Fungal N-terminal domain-containing protein n=1 Tax=Dendrothele bispora (strain CBS 962.96) TaxID=1314807 RepID=A0A4S8KWI3_DENBC|nr:hypothetical protein K435DRAFT_874497 [Dendrothele bispora CBS 962.96]
MEVTSFISLLSSLLNAFSNATAIVASLVIILIVALYFLISSYYPCLNANKLDHIMHDLKKTVEDCRTNEVHLSLREDDSEAYIKVRQKYARIRMQNNVLRFAFSTTYLGARVKIIRDIVECHQDAHALNASLQNCIERKRLLQYDLEAQYLTSTNTARHRPSRTRAQSSRAD